MPTPTRDAFNRLIVDPSALSQPERVDVLRRVAGSLQASTSRDEAWVGTILVRWLNRGGDLAALFGVRPRRGSRRTAQRIVREAASDRALVRLATVAGSDRRALRMLRGQDEAPASLQPLLAEARALGAPVGDGAVSRARRRVARQG